MSGFEQSIAWTDETICAACAKVADPSQHIVEGMAREVIVAMADNSTSSNQLLAQLPCSKFAVLEPHLKPVELPLRKALAIDRVHFLQDKAGALDLADHIDDASNRHYQR